MTGGSNFLDIVAKLNNGDIEKLSQKEMFMAMYMELKAIKDNIHKVEESSKQTDETVTKLVEELAKEVKISREEVEKLAKDMNTFKTKIETEISTAKWIGGAGATALGLIIAVIALFL